MLRLTRPQQWVKNAVALAGLVFAAVAGQPSDGARAIGALVAFVLAIAAGLRRHSLHGLTAPLLDLRVRTTAINAPVTYATYLVVSESVTANHAILFTVPYVGFTTPRYHYLVYGLGVGERPESLLFRNRWLVVSVLLWGASSLANTSAAGHPWPFA